MTTTSVNHKEDVVTTEDTATTEKIQILPDSVYDYNVEDTFLVPKD